MRFLGVSETCDLLSLYRQLLAEGHEVRVAISEPTARGTGAGLVDQVEDWRGSLPWIREAGRDGVILFESVSEGFGVLQDMLRKEGYQVIGGSAYGDRLENDRAFAQNLLGGLGFPSNHIWEFDDANAAGQFIARRPARYVLKYSGPDHASSDNYLGQLEDGSDVRAVLADGVTKGTAGKFILMEFIRGIETGVGAYFDGERFITPACLDWEHKRFFPGDLGELTGEMGTVATFMHSDRFFDRTLRRLEPLLRGHGHVGYVNLNTIVNEDGIWPLEFTCRFGYPGFAILAPLQRTPWGELFQAMIEGAGGSLAVRPGFSVGIVLTTPPFPYTRKQIDAPTGLPVVFRDAPSPEDARNIHYGEVGLRNGRLVTTGLYGWTMVVTGIADTIEEARSRAYALTRSVVIPNVRYRDDIGARLAATDYDALRALGYLDAVDS